MILLAELNVYCRCMDVSFGEKGTLKILSFLCIGLNTQFTFPIINRNIYQFCSKMLRQYSVAYERTSLTAFKKSFFHLLEFLQTVMHHALEHLRNFYQKPSKLTVFFLINIGDIESARNKHRFYQKLRKLSVFFQINIKGY